MLITAALLLLLVTLGTLAFYRLRLKISTVILMALWVLYWVLGIVGTTTELVIVGIAFPLLVVINFPWLRAQLI